MGGTEGRPRPGGAQIMPAPIGIQVQPAFAPAPSADAVSPEETAPNCATALAWDSDTDEGVTADTDDDGLIGDNDVCAHPTTNTVPTTTATAASETRTDMEHSFVNQDDEQRAPMGTQELAVLPQ